MPQVYGGCDMSRSLSYGRMSVDMFLGSQQTGSLVYDRRIGSRFRNEQ